MFENHCPYCGEEVEINTDDGYGLEDGKTFQQECGHCEKTFIFTTDIIINHTTEKADCLNGSPHDFRPVVHTPPAWPNWVRCKVCGEEVQGDLDAKIFDDYRARGD